TWASGLMRRASKTEIWSCLETTRSDTISLAKALISPFFWSITTRNSRAGPTAFFAAASRASLTAATRTSRLMPFSRSQNSRTAKKSAFIYVLDPRSGNKKVGRIISDSSRWQTSKLYRSVTNIDSPKTESSGKIRALQFRQWGWNQDRAAGGRDIFWRKPEARFSNGLAAWLKWWRRVELAEAWVG